MPGRLRLQRRLGSVGYLVIIVVNEIVSLMRCRSCPWRRGRWSFDRVRIRDPSAVKHAVHPWANGGIYRVHEGASGPGCSVRVRSVADGVIQRTDTGISAVRMTSRALRKPGAYPFRTEKLACACFSVPG